MTSCEKKAMTLFARIFGLTWKTGFVWDENYINMSDWAKEIDVFFVQNNFLCRAQVPTSEKRRPFINRQVMMPLFWGRSLVEEYHNSSLSGHLAYHRTFQKL